MSRIVETFAPSQPVANSSFFVGRAKQLQQLIDAIEEHRDHIIVVGARGTGKTSLALNLLSAANRANYTTVYVSCSRASTVESIFNYVCAKIPRRFDSAVDPSRELASSTFADLLPKGEVTTQMVGELLSRVTATRLLIVLDEFDLQKDNNLKTEIIELMKSLSDQVAPVHIVLIGVGNSPEDLLGDQQSIPRSLFRMKLNPMSDDEMETAIERLATIVDITIPPKVLKELVSIAQGKMFVAKLIALRAAKMAVINNSRVVSESVFIAAVAQLCEHFRSAGFGMLQDVIDKNPPLQFILRGISRTIREVGDVFTAEEVYARCSGQGLGSSIERIELVLYTLAEARNILRLSEKNGKQAFYFVDPTIELAISLLLYRLSSVPADFSARNSILSTT